MLDFPFLFRKRIGSWRLYVVFFAIAIIIVIIALCFLSSQRNGSYIPVF